MIDEATNTVTHAIPVGRFPTDGAVNPCTDTIYVTNYAE